MIDIYSSGPIHENIAFMQEIDEAMTKFENANGMSQTDPKDATVKT